MTILKPSNIAPLALTMGDPSGIGLDLTITAWTLRDELNLPAFIYIGDIHVLAARAHALDIDIEVTECQPEEAAHHFATSIPALHIPCPHIVVIGEPSPDNAPAIIGSIETAVKLCQNGDVSGVVTNPIAKSVLYEAGFLHPGHTEFLAELCKGHADKAPLPIMLLAGPELKSVPVTIHIPLMKIMDTLTTELIIQTARITAQDLTHRFGIAHPRLAISGLNPHAGEDGALGHEDADIIQPAIEALLAQGFDVIGPLPADTMFHEDARKTFDVAICMYHDQALIPAKALGFHDAVNATLGLDIIRTSPDHGTAFSIAGKNIARHDSLVAALHMAHDMALNQSRST